MDRPAPPVRPSDSALAAGILLVVALVALGSPGDAVAQSSDHGVGSPAEAHASAPVDPGAGPAEGPDAAPARIDGFWGVSWGADSAAVAGRLGRPITIGRGGDGLRYFVYTPLYLGRDGFLQMWLHEDRGLVGASWEPMISDCGDMLRRLVRATREVHPDVPVRTEGRMTRDMLGGDLCVAALEEGASVTVVWEDSAGTQIRVGTTPGSHKLRMRATTPALRESRPGGV